MPSLVRLGLCLILWTLVTFFQVPRLAAEGPKKSDKVLPFWTKPDAKAREGLGKVIRQRSRAVVLVGNPKKGYGTAWVLSAKHRLLATNAHVADIFYRAKGKMFAIVNGTGQLHRVRRIWYHPGVRRKVFGGKISMRAACPEDGDVHAGSPDVAVLELDPEGPELTTELQMATPKEVEKLFARTIGMLGFPGHSMGRPNARGSGSWPSLGEKAQATYHDGVVSRLTDFNWSVDGPYDELQFVQHTASGWGGFSGSPLILPNGHVVALHNSGRVVTRRKAPLRISHGVRIDCLWELLVHHDLDKKVPVPVDESRLRIRRWLRLGPQEKQFRRAVALVREATSLIDHKNRFLDGVRKCNEAEKLVPQYPDLYRVRCAGWTNYYFYERPPKSRARTVLTKALEDANKYAELNASDPRSVIVSAHANNNLAVLTQNDRLFRNSLANLNKALGVSSLDKSLRAELYSLRGACRFNLRDSRGAKNDYNSSVRLDPTNPFLYDNRARYWEAIGSDTLAEDDRRTARELRRKMLEALR